MAIGTHPDARVAADIAATRVVADRAIVNPSSTTGAGVTAPAVNATVDVAVNYLPDGMVNGDADKLVYVEGFGHLQATALSATSLRLKNIGFQTPGTVLSFGKAVQLLTGSSTATRSDPKIEFWIPDPYAWEDTAVVNPLEKGPVFRVGSKLYMFGGYDGAANSALIYSADYDASGTTPVFTSTGASLPAAALGLRVVLIGANFYAYGGKGAVPTTPIWTATLAAPTVWSNTGSVITRRDNAPIIVSSTRISIIGGHDGTSGFNTVQSALLATPTAIVTSAGVMNNNWEAGASIVGSDLLGYWGGTGVEISVLRKARASVLNLYGTIPSTTPALPMNIGGSTEMFSNGDHHFVPGPSAGTTDVVIFNSDLSSHQRVPGVLVRNGSYPYGAQWIGGDGRAYYVTTDATRRIQRSYRKRVWVRASEVNAANLVGSYAPMMGVTDDGTPAVVSTHVRMGTAPWLTNLRTTF